MRKFILKGILFLGMLPFFYGIILFALCRIELHGVPLVFKILKTSGEAGGNDFDLVRFQEIESFKDIDLLFLGSSHAFRSFDPRFFQSYGLKSFVLGSRAQTPVNSYYLLKHYEPKLKPKRIVFELFFKVFETPSGLESFYGLVLNLPLFKELFQMALATHSMEALNSFFSESFVRQRHPLTDKVQRSFPGYEYIPGGYIETHNVISEKITPGLNSGVLAPRQLKYLKKIIRYAQDRKIPIVLVSQPLPQEYRQSVVHYQEMIRQFKRVAAALGVRYYDFNEVLDWDTYSDFCDEHHLNASGVRKFNESLLKTIPREFFALPSTEPKELVSSTKN